LDYYCSQKFWWLSIDIEKMQTLSCCAATPHKINTQWLTQNPGTLFNTVELQTERQMMLDGHPVTGCFSNCGHPESKGLPSRRLEMKSNVVTHTEINATPEVLHIIVGSDCNMTCSYCCKQYSSAWKQDILNNGEYSVQTNDDRYKLNALDRVTLNLSQKDIAKSKISEQLIQEITLTVQQKSCPQVNITGGEPFLYLALENLISKLPVDVNVCVWSGLGVATTRFSKIVDNLLKYPNVSITISAENIQDYYEFNRYGNSWKQFETNLNTLRQSGIPYNFNATVSNLTLFGLPAFFEYTKDCAVTYSPCTDPEFQSINVLDYTSKQLVLKNLSNLPNGLQKLISNSIVLDATNDQIKNLQNYLTAFASRRNLSLDLFPTSFKQWING
jgi:organic radical activating enzyme